MADYQFKYSPLTGRITGKQMLEQTEQAINALASQVDSAAGQVEIISTLANEANENAATALETAEEALATTGRTYITVSGQTDANIYYDSQLIYIADSTSTNIPVADTGMLEVKTNDNKTACEQVFIADSSGDAYYRNGAITAETVGDVTTYTVTWGGWSSQPASQAYVQGELANYLPLSGGTVTGGLTVEGNITGNLVGNATSATNDADGNPIAGTYLPAVVGAVVAFAGSTSPAGWLLCDGSAVSRTTYAALFAVIGTTYGAGNGSTTFNLPNLTDKFIQGNSTSGTVKNAGLPNITGEYTQCGFSGAAITILAQGAFSSAAGTTQNLTSLAGAGNPNSGYKTLFKASSSNSIYGNSTTVQPPALTMRYIIKY